MELEVDRLLVTSQDGIIIKKIHGKTYSEEISGRNIKTLGDNQWLDSSVFKHFFI